MDPDHPSTLLTFHGPGTSSKIVWLGKGDNHVYTDIAIQKGSTGLGSAIITQIRS